MSLPTPIDLFSSTSRTCAEVARLAGDAAFWTFVQRITRSSIPVHIPIATEIDKVLSEVFYAVGACQEAFNNQGRAIHILRLWPMLIKGTVCLKGSLDKITKEELGSITPNAGSFVIVDSKGTLLAWHIKDVISPRLQRIAEAATLKLNSQAPALLQDGPPDLPSTWHNWSPENPDALMLRSGAINISPLCMESNTSSPSPSPDVLENLEAVEEYLEAMSPIAYILYAVSVIIHPAVSRRHWTLSKLVNVKHIQNRKIATKLLEGWGFPFPYLSLVQNSGFPRDLVQRGEVSDWSMEAHFGDFTGGKIRYAPLPLSVPAPAGTITAQISGRFDYEVTPAVGNRFILSLQPDPDLSQYFGLETTTATRTVEDTKKAKNPPETVVAFMAPEFILTR